MSAAVSCDEIRKNAVGLAALSAADPERLAAWRHAASCAKCQKALKQGQYLMNILDRAPPLEGPSSEVLDGVARKVLEEMGEVEREKVKPLPWRLPPLVVGALVVVLLALRSKPIPGRDVSPAGILGALAALGAAGAVALARVILVGAALFSAAFSLAFGESGALAPAAGLHCLGTELVLSLAPLAVVSFIALRRRDTVGGPVLAAVGATAALAVQAGLHLRCPSLAMKHLMVFHTGGVLAAMAVGYAFAMLVGLRRAIRSST